MVAAYWFEVRGIQRFLSEGGRLRDVIGGSELVDWLARWEGNDLLAAALGALGASERELSFTRRAGGAFVALAPQREPLARLRALFNLALRQAVPGLEYGDAIAEAADEVAAVTAARARATVRRNGEAELVPPLGPHLERAPRTGRPAVVRDRDGDDLLDALLRAKRRFADATALLARFCADWRDWNWPVDLAAEDPEHPRSFPFGEGRRLVAVVHIDGNGLGLHLERLHKAGVGSNTFAAFSRTLTAITQHAAQSAATEVLKPAAERDRLRCMPARPVLLGGDDLTAIVRADLALGFATAFLQAFAKESQARLATVHPTLAGGMTAAAGIAVVRAGHPWHHAHALADTLCRAAKRRFRRDGESPWPSIAFARVQSTLAEDVEELVAHEARVPVPGSPVHRTTLGAYALDGAQPRFAELVALAKLVAGAGAAGGLRQVEATLYVDPGAAARAFARWRRNLEERAGPAGLHRQHRCQESEETQEARIHLPRPGRPAARGAEGRA